jgi:23S rRNA (pseudouridine1915-N3)-methyltransferase
MNYLHLIYIGFLAYSVCSGIEVYEKMYRLRLSMKILLSSISRKQTVAPGPLAELLQLYLGRAARYTPCAHRIFPTESKLLDFVSETAGRTRPALFLADSRGQQLTSEDLAATLGSFQEAGTQQLILAIGPADGWSPAALSRADRTVAFGRITLPHELAAVVAAEQLYRALTIRAGHPYHSGH